MFGEIEAITTSITGQSDKVAGILAELSEIFNGSGINPETSVVGNSESGFSIQGGGTFVADEKVHGSLANQLNDIVASSEKYGSSEITGAGKVSKELKVLTAMGEGLKTASSEYVNLSNLVQEKIQNIDSLKEMLRKGFNKLYELASTDSSQEINKGSIKDIEDKVFSAFDKELGQLQNILKVQIKPTQKDLLDLLKKNKSFTTLAETLGVQYGNETASDRLALVFTNMSDIKILADKVKNALKELNISNSEYKNITNSEKLYNQLYKVFEKINNKKIKSDLTKVFEAMSILKNAHGKHEQIVKELKGSNDIFGTNESSSSESESSSSESESDKPGCSAASEIEGGAYEKEIGRQRKTRLQSSLSKRIDTYQKTLKELYKSFMNQVNRNFKELSTLIDLLSTKIGSEIAYDDDLKDFINMFKGFNEDIDNEKIFYSLIGLDTTVAGRELKARFGDTLNKIIDSCSKLKNYKVFTDINTQLKHFKETIDTMGDTVNSLKKTEAEKSGSSDFMWTDKLVEQSFSMNNIKLIKDSIKKLSFYGKVSTIKENLHRMNKEQKLYQEDYDKLLGKSIGLKLTELQREYVENVDRLNDKQRGRGRLLEEYNKGKPANQQIPRGLVETIYKLQYEAKEGLYKSLEAIDLYLMHFTESLSAHPEAVMDLHKMLEQTDIIAKWFTKKSVDNLVELFGNNIDKQTDNLPAGLLQQLNIPPLLQNKAIAADKIKTAFEQTKKCIDSIAILKNILSMFIHLGEKYGNVNLTEKLHISPNMIYKHLVKYIWVSAFTMGYGTGGGDKGAKNTDTTNKGLYEPETGDTKSFFDVLFTTIILPLDVYKNVESVLDSNLNYLLDSTRSITPPSKTSQLYSSSSVSRLPVTDKLVLELKDRLKKDIFIIDDRYFILGLKAIVGKIFTVVDTHTLLHTPDTLANVMRNPVRMIIGAGSTPDVIPEAIELYIRLPLLVEFYKTIFEDGNQIYKNNDNSVKNSELEIIAYIPEIGTVWSGLIQCIFDESKYIKDGIYGINNIKDIVSEINKIYNNYKSTPKDKLVRTVVLDLVAEINRRYGILKKKDIAEFYQVKKKYIKNVVDSKFEDNVNFDILDENNEYERAGPSSQYFENTFNKYSDDSLIFEDIKSVRSFRNKIYNELFENENLTKQLSKHSFSEKIKQYKKQILSTESIENKFELISQAIDQSSNINAYNVDVYLLFHELVMSPLDILKKYNTNLQNEYINNTKNSTKANALQLLINLYRYFNDNNLFKIKMISNSKFIIDYSKFQTIVESYIENIKYMLSKFRNLICIELVKDQENQLYQLENELLNIIIKDDSSAENYKSSITLENLNVEINKSLADTTKKSYRLKDLYNDIMFSNTKTNTITRNNNLLKDINTYYDATNRKWVNKTNIKYYDYIIPDDKIELKTFQNHSLLQKFNTLVFTYLTQFYNSSTKKIYSGLFDEFANKTLSGTIFENGGIPDMVIDAGAAANYNINYPLIKNSTILSMSNVTILRTLLTRTLNIQLPVKYHLLDNLNDVSSVQIEKYKAYLPMFITYFEQLIKQCIVYKRIVDNTYLTVTDIVGSINPDNYFTNKNNYNLTDDFNIVIDYDTILENSTGNKFSNYKNHFHEILNNIINASRALVNDARYVLNELNFVPQFGNVRENFIKNFYNNNRELPFLPISILNPIMDTGLSLIQPLLPIYPLGSDMNKYIYATNYIFNNLSNQSIKGSSEKYGGVEDEDINNYLWLKVQLQKYNGSALSTNLIEAKKVTQFLNLNKQLLESSYFNNHVNNCLFSLPSNTLSATAMPFSPPGVAPTGTRTGVAPSGVAPSGVAPSGVTPSGVAPSGVAPLGVAPLGVAPSRSNPFTLPYPSGQSNRGTRLPIPTEPLIVEQSNDNQDFIIDIGQPDDLDALEGQYGLGESGRYGGYYFAEFYVGKAAEMLSDMMNLIENVVNENKKYEIAKYLKTKCASTSPGLDEYSLDRKKPRILNIIDLNINPINIHALMREVPLINIYNYAFTFDDIIRTFIANVNPDKLYTNLSGTPADPYKNSLNHLSLLLQDPYYINYKNTTGAKSTEEIMKSALQITNQPTSFDPKKPNVYLSKPKYTYNFVEEAINTLGSSGTKTLTPTLIYNNKFLRNIAFLVNLQRVIRLKVKNAVYKINTNVVSDTNILNMRITDYPTDSTDINDDEFEITDLF